MLRLRKVQIVNDDKKEETAIEAVWVTDGIDCCRVGFLPRHLIKHWRSYQGVLCQVTEVYDPEDRESLTKRKKDLKNKGCALAAIISTPLAPPPPGNKKDIASTFRTPAQKRRVSDTPAFDIVRSPRTKRSNTPTDKSNSNST